MSHIKTIQPTFSRFDRVNTVLRADAGFNKNLSEPSVEVIKPGKGGKVLFSPEVIKVTQDLHARGVDIHKAGKRTIMKAVIPYMNNKDVVSAAGEVVIPGDALTANSAPSNGAPAPKKRTSRSRNKSAKPVVAAPKEAPSKRAAPKRAAPKKTAPKKAAAPKGKKPVKSKKKKTKKVAAAQPAAPEPSPASPPKAKNKSRSSRPKKSAPKAAAPGKSAAVARDKDVEQDLQNVYQFAYSNLFYATAVLEKEDRMPGASERLKRLDDIKQELFELSVKTTR